MAAASSLGHAPPYAGLVSFCANLNPPQHGRLVDYRGNPGTSEPSQNQFAKNYGIALGTLRHWEQGRGEVPMFARILLTIIDKEPEAVMRALRR
jgi:hypothetical protein